MKYAGEHENDFTARGKLYGELGRRLGASLGNNVLPAVSLTQLCTFLQTSFSRQSENFCGMMVMVITRRGHDHSRVDPTVP
jgi:energy-converting hydrogenase Eha subunit B